MADAVKLPFVAAVAVADMLAVLAPGAAPQAEVA